MRTILIKILSLIYFFAYFVVQIFCQYDENRHEKLYDWYEDKLTDGSSTYYRIFTPLCNQKDKDYRNFDITWTDAQVEHCRQVWLKEGGLFKMTGECTFSEKNNYLNELKARCIAIDGNYIYIGTGNGIYLSTDYGERWLTPDEDGINNLTGKIINAISIRGGRIFAGTDSGIFVSTDNGANWTRSLPNCNITCIEFGRDNDVFVGSAKEQHNGIYKSSNFGDSWSHFSFILPVYCLKYIDGMTFFAGVEDGFYESTDEGQNWTLRYTLNSTITTIYINASDIYIGTINRGCYKSTNGGINFYTQNIGLPEVNGYYHKINCIEKLNEILYCATDYGLYYAEISSPLSWSRCIVIDDNISSFRNFIAEESLIKMIYIDDSVLWAVCSESENPKWKTSKMIDYFEPPSPLSPTNFGNYNCHTFAWHLWEGGSKGVGLPNPFDKGYISLDNRNDWDYIETNWNDPLWDKVTYHFNNQAGNSAHSGIKSPNMTKIPDEEDEQIVISKWHLYGPLVEHNLRDNPWGNEELYICKYWKSKKIIDKETITTDRFIGRQLITDESESELTTIIPEGSDVKFYVAPMYEHKIHLKSGFHAERGSNFQAFIKDKSKDGCEIPWETEPDYIEGEIILADNITEVTLDTNPSINQREKIITYSNSATISSELDTSSCPYPMRYGYVFPGKGSGTKEDPYQITNIKELDFVGQVFPTSGEYLYFVLMNDIDASETKYWNPIVDKNGDTVYRGFWISSLNYVRILDGQGHIVKNLHMPSTGGESAHLFKNLACSKIRRIGFENLQIGPHICYSHLFDGMALDTGFVMEECFFTGKIVSALPNFGSAICSTSILGVFYNTNMIIKNCYVDIEVVQDSLVYGFARTYEIKRKPTDRYMEVRFENCYTTSRTTAKNKVYSPFGYGGNVIACFWDSDLYKPTEPLGKGIGLPTSEMMKRETFESAGWDFENIWYIEEGKDYPKLRAFKRDTTNVQEGPLIKELIIKPNPASDYIEVAVPSEQIAGGVQQVRIYNMLGQCIINYELGSSNNEARAKIDIRHLPAGLYYIRIGGNGLPFVKN